MKQITLNNGLRIFLYPQPYLRSACVGVWVKSGSRYEKSEVNGISHFIEHMVFKGSLNRTAAEIASQADDIGATLNAYTTKEYTFFYARSLGDNIVAAADILFDILKNPRFDERDIETEKGVVLEEIAMCEDDPADVCSEQCEKSCLAGCGLYAPILGTRETVSAFNRAQLEEHMSAFYTPGAMVIGVSGSFDEQAVVALIERCFESGRPRPLSLETPRFSFEPKISTVKAAFEQTHIILSFNGVGLDDDDFYPLELVLFALATGSSSRLSQRLREQLGLVYSVDGWVARFLDGGYIGIQMSLSSRNQKKALYETCKIIREIGAGLSERELKRAAEKLISSFIIGREYPQTRFSSVGYSLLMLSKYFEDDEIIKKIRAVTLEQARRVCNEYFDLSRCGLTAVAMPLKEHEYEKILKTETDSDKA